MGADLAGVSDTKAASDAGAAAGAEAAAWGAVREADGFRFRLWAPGHERVELLIGEADEAHPLEDAGNGWRERFLPGVPAATRYRYRLSDGAVVPDPASRWQPEGVHGRSATVDPAAFGWSEEEWQGLPLEDAVLYELHVGTFTPEGTFDAVIERLDAIRALGATAIEIMPVAQFPGVRNWGYDGVFPYAPQDSYGGPDGFRRLVDAAHRTGLAVVLDVVYNHLGPEGNYLPAVTSGRIFTERHSTPWGAAINFDDRGSSAVREFFIANALHWIREYHVDGLRLDATHAIEDNSEEHVLVELVRRLRAAARHPLLIFAEDERNERRLLETPDRGGAGIDAVWADDFHHSLRRLVAGDREGYYAAYEGTTAEVVTALGRGWLYEGQVYPPSGEPRGTPAAGIPPARFVHCIQNHDQVGNRALGERLNHQVEPGVYRATSALLLLSPHTPLLWMGQEWAASSPFQYFTSHSEELGALVTEGRRSEFKHFSAFSDEPVRDRIPDPQAEATFERSKLDWAERELPDHAAVLALYRALIQLRRTHPTLRRARRDCCDEARLGEHAIALRRRGEAADLLVIVNFAGALDTELGRFEIANTEEGGEWRLLLSTEAAEFGGAGEEGFDAGHVRLAGPAALVLGGPASG